MCRVKLDQNLIISQFMDLPVGDLWLRFSHSFFCICALCCLEGDDHKSPGFLATDCQTSATLTLVVKNQNIDAVGYLLLLISKWKEKAIVQTNFPKDEWNAHYMMNEWMNEWNKRRKKNRLW